MKQILHITFFLFAVLSFGQDIKTKTIEVFVFGDVSYIKTQIPVFEANILIYIDGTVRETKTDKDGKFQIEVKEGDELTFSVLGYDEQKILITDKNCYKIFLWSKDFDVWESRKTFKKNRRYYRKLEKEILKKEKKGIYDCFD